MPARRTYPVPSGLKPVRRKLATGEMRVYWYHRASGKRLEADPTTPAGTDEIAALDRQAGVVGALSALPRGTFAELWGHYRQSPEWRGLKPRTRSDYQAVRDWLGPAADKAVLGRLSAGQIFSLRDKAAKAKGRRFANYVVQVMRLVLEWGRKRDFCKVNAAKDVNLIRKPIGEAKVNRAWSAAEVEAFTRAAPVQLLVPFALGLFAGMRQGDALRITWSAFDGSTLRWVAGKNGEACLAPATGPLKAILAKAKGKRGDAVQIAVTATGTPWTASGFRASFFKHIRKLQAVGAVRPGCTFHGLRHTIATLARNDGESDSRTAAAIGDRSPAMAQIYGRDADRAAAQNAILEAVQKRFQNIDWKTGAADWKTRQPRRAAKSLK